MNKDEVDNLAGKCGEPYWEKYALPNDLPSGFIFEESQLLAFANACEKIGIERAAKICTEQGDISFNLQGTRNWATSDDCAKAIRSII